MADYAGKEFLDQATQSLQGGQFQQALELVGNAIALGPDNAEAFVLKGIAESQLSRPHEAVESFKRAMELDPASPKAAFNLAVHYYGAGQKQEALTAARQALAADPAHAGARDLVQRLEGELNIPGAPSPDAVSGATPPMRPTAFTPAADTGQWRPGYELPAHSLRWVENMEAAWGVIGWLLVAISIGLGVLFWATVGPEIMKIFQAAMSDPTAAQRMQPHIPTLMSVVVWIAYGVRVLGMLWMIFDLVDRRGPWLWLLPFLLCGVCGLCLTFGLESLTMGIYLIVSRSKK